MAITREELNEYHTISNERRALERKAEALKTREAVILAKAHAEILPTGKNQIVRFGFPIVLEPGRANVSWKDAFIEECGVDAASKLQEDAAKQAQQDKKVKILPPAPLAATGAAAA